MKMNYWVTARKYIEYYIKRRGITNDDIKVGHVAVVSWAPGPILRMAQEIDAQPVEYWPTQKRYPLFTGEMEGVPVSFAHAPVGAPTTVAQMEQMIACGTRIFLGLGWAGSLNPIAPVGSLLIPTRCIREEGTSYHYVAKDCVVQADSQLASILKQTTKNEDMLVNSGPHWTTDAIYRESEEKIDAYRELGVLGVDMETSAMFALGKVYNLRVANLLVVSDSLWGEWRMSFGTDEIKNATHKAEKVIMQALAKVIEKYNKGI
jgi:uridine phosphorylase